MSLTAWQNFQQVMHGKKVLLFGLGLLGGGENVARVLCEAGAVVRITDIKTKTELGSTLQRLQDLPLEFTLGEHKEEDILWAELIVKNPSVPYTQPVLIKAQELGKQITNEVALFLQFTQTRTIGVTGTRGKTTTTAMILDIFRRWDPRTQTAGNLPHKPAIGLLKQEQADTWTVLELSSFQLEGCHDAKVSPHAAVVTNLYPDHLNRYLTLEAYATAKAAILAYQSAQDVAVLSRENEWTPFFERQVRGQFVLAAAPDLPGSLQLRVPGQHNRENAAMAMSVAALLKVPVGIIHVALQDFPGVPFRLETVGKKDGVVFINDTTSTTPVALNCALDTISHPLLIAGGASKQLDWSVAAQKINQLAKKVYLLDGTGTQEVLSLLDEKIIAGVFSSLADAFEAAVRDATTGDTVLLSPGFASFGMFVNEFERGEQFNQLVQKHGAR